MPSLGRGDDDHAPKGSEAADRSRKSVARRVEGDLEPGRQGSVVGIGADGVAEGTQFLGLFWAPDGEVNLSGPCPSEIRSGAPDSACAHDEESSALANGRALQAIPRRGEGHAKARGLRKGEGFGQERDAATGQGQELGMAAVAVEPEVATRAPHVPADKVPRPGRDDAGEVTPRNTGGGRIGEKTQDILDVARVQAGGLHGHAHLPGFRRRHRHGLDGKPVEAPHGVEPNGLHHLAHRAVPPAAAGRHLARIGARVLTGSIRKRRVASSRDDQGETPIGWRR